jgi:hypothetical protein
MQDRSGTQGQALAVAGGAGLAISLWLPWYTVEIPQSALNSVTQMSQQFGALGSLIRSGAQLISQLGPFHLTSWQAFKTLPAVVLVNAIIGGGLALLALTDRAGNTSRLTMLAGGVGALLVGYRIAVPPGQGGFVHPAWGIYLGLIGALAMLAGGFLANQASSDGVTVTAFPAAGPAPATGPFAPTATAAAPLTPTTDPFAAPASAAAAIAPVTPSADSWSSAQSVPPPAA